jgi:hypothetical protein
MVVVWIYGGVGLKDGEHDFLGRKSTHGETPIGKQANSPAIPATTWWKIESNRRCSSFLFMVLFFWK